MYESAFIDFALQITVTDDELSQFETFRMKVNCKFKDNLSSMVKKISDWDSLLPRAWLHHWLVIFVSKVSDTSL